MPESLLELEQQRADLRRQMAQLGDMRAGSVTPTGGRCGNPHCHCHQPKDAGHGPYYRLTRKVAGKTVTETLSSPAARRKAEQEVDEYHRFRRLSQALLEVNERICSLRPLSEAATPEEKKRRKPSSMRSRKK
jgi:hypothetical protein